MKRIVSINIESEVWKSFRIMCIEKDKSASKRVEEMMEKDLESNKK